jgi:4-hydroxy-tetrahydrodipicolinate synthase
MEPETICRIADTCPSVVAIKESTGSMDQASQILSASELTVLSGDDSLTLPLLAVGATGVVSVAGNLVPADVKAMLTAFAAGDTAAAMQCHHRLFPLCREMLGLSTNPIPVKAAMRLLGRECGDVRLPLTPLSDAQVSALRTTLQRYGLL